MCVNAEVWRQILNLQLLLASRTSWGLCRWDASVYSRAALLRQITARSRGLWTASGALCLCRLSSLTRLDTGPIYLFSLGAMSNKMFSSTVAFKSHGLWEAYATEPLFLKTQAVRIRCSWSTITPSASRIIISLLERLSSTHRLGSERQNRAMIAMNKCRNIYVYV